MASTGKGEEEDDEKKEDPIRSEAENGSRRRRRAEKSPGLLLERATKAKTKVVQATVDGFKF